MISAFSFALCHICSFTYSLIDLLTNSLLPYFLVSQGFAISVTEQACAGATVLRNVPKNKSRLPARNPPVSGQYYPVADSLPAASPDAVLCFCSFLTLRYKGKMLVSSWFVVRP
jgi:hypothetical protein